MTYEPDQGDVVWIDFDPQAGREQAGRRPGLVLSRLAYNRPSGLFLLCPITSRVKGYPYEVVIPDGLPVHGAILADHVKSLDWRARQIEFMVKFPDSIVTDVIARLNTLLT